MAEKRIQELKLNLCKKGKVLLANNVTWPGIREPVCTGRSCRKHTCSLQGRVVLYPRLQMEVKFSLHAGFLFALSDTSPGALR